MPDTSEQVISVQYCFSTSDLLAHVGYERYETEKSVERYMHFCDEALTRAYPNAVIEIFDRDRGGDLINTTVYIQYEDQILEDENKAITVEAICEQIFNELEWPADKMLTRIIELSDRHTNLPRSVVRWACSRDLIKGAGKPYDFWDVPLKTLSGLSEQIEFCDRENLIVPSAYKRKACYFEDVNTVTFGQLPEQIEIVLATQHRFGIPSLASNTSTICISKNASQVHIQVEHFVDVEKWVVTEWTYQRYVLALVAQAQKRGIHCECQTNARNASIDGVSFHFTVTIEPTTTLQVLVEASLQNLNEVIVAAEIELAGGPDIDDPIYQRNEDRFCREVLEPLLNEMRFDSVTYTHGTKEHGRDFFFEYKTPFGKPIYFGLQAKRKGLSGGANNEIGTIVEQLQLAFEHPYIKKDGDFDTKCNISIMIVAISGDFTDDAIEVIRKRFPRYFPKGSVFFWGKDRIRNLISHYWGRRNK